MNSTIIRGQKVDRTKLQRAKELRQAMTPAEKLLWGQLHANGLVGFISAVNRLLKDLLLIFIVTGRD